MKIRYLTVVFLLIYLMTQAGCNYEVFNRKFVRKKKAKAGPPPIYQIQPFLKPPNIDIYSHAFIFWKTWENELLIALSPSGNPRVVNNLKIKECLQQAISNLDQMKDCLNDKKAKELDGYINQIEQYNTFLENQNLSDMTLARMRHDIEGHKRNVDIRFCPSNVRPDILIDEPSLDEKPQAENN